MPVIDSSELGYITALVPLPTRLVMIGKPELTNQMPCYIISRWADYKMKSLIRPAVGQIAELIQSSLPILAVVYRFFYLPIANLPIYHNLPVSNYSQSVRWSKRPASQCVRRLVKASDVIGQSIRCDWSKHPM